jgi:hypothetical protein
MAAPADPRVAALFRMAVGGLVLINMLASAPSAEMWWGERGLLPRAAARLVMDRHTFSLFDWLPATDRTLWLLWSALAIQAALLAVGLFSRFQAACVFILLLSFQHRNGLICDAEDGLFRLFSLLLVFMPAAGDAWSLDAWIRRRRGRPKPPPRGSWALRMAQFQVCLVMLMAGLHKLEGATWRDGTAIYYVFQLDDWSFHGPIPRFVRESMLLSRVFSWATVGLEVAAPILIWWKETRRAVLVALLLFHLSLEYSMNLFLFQWIMLAGWLTHGQRSDLRWIQQLFRRMPLPGWRSGHTGSTFRESAEIQPAPDAGPDRRLARGGGAGDERGLQGP